MTHNMTQDLEQSMELANQVSNELEYLESLLRLTLNKASDELNDLWSPLNGIMLLIESARQKSIRLTATFTKRGVEVDPPRT